MPPRSSPTSDPVPSAADLLTPENVREFRQKAVLYSLATIGGVALWMAMKLPFQVAVPLVGAAGVEAWKNIRRWQEWRQTHPGWRVVHPDRRKAMEQETVRILADAAKARAWLTRGIIALITVPSAIELLTGVERAVAVASVDAGPIQAGEHWRLLGGTYLHGSLYHYFGNMSALLIYGAILEMKDARLRLPLVYLLSALGGSVLSVLMPPDVPSVGASGGVVGVIAYLYLLSRRQLVRFPSLFRSATASVFVGLFVAGALGFWYIDNPGHAGGAIAGLVVAALVVDPARNYGEPIETPILDFFGWIAMAVLAGGAALTSAKLIASIV